MKDIKRALLTYIRWWQFKVWVILSTISRQLNFAELEHVGCARFLEHVRFIVVRIEVAIAKSQMVDIQPNNLLVGRQSPVTMRICVVL